MKQYIVYTTVLFNGRTFEHQFNITLLDSEELNAATFFKYAHIKQNWEVLKINHIVEITVNLKYADFPCFDLYPLQIAN